MELARNNHYRTRSPRGIRVRVTSKHIRTILERNIPCVQPPALRPAFSDIVFPTVPQKETNPWQETEPASLTIESSCFPQRGETESCGQSWHTELISFRQADCSTCCLLDAAFFFGLFLNPEDEGDVFLRNVFWLSKDYTVLYPRWQNSS
jgi:hypothetical protein